jgi:hypothetical protein
MSPVSQPSPSLFSGGAAVDLIRRRVAEKASQHEDVQTPFTLTVRASTIGVRGRQASLTE